MWGFDPLDLGRPPSAARVRAEQLAQTIIRDLQGRMDRLLPSHLDLDKIRPPNSRQALEHVIGFAGRLERLASRYGQSLNGAGSGNVLAKLWEAWTIHEGCHSAEEIHRHLKELDDNLAETVRRLHEGYEQPDPANPAGPKVIPAEWMADYQSTLNIIVELFAIRRAALVGELNEIQSALSDNWFTRGPDAWILLESKWKDWADD